MEELIAKYADKGFAYALVVYLLWRDRDVIVGFRNELASVRVEVTQLKESLLTLLGKLVDGKKE